ncbi:class I SAM-dependent methyltransferase [Hyphococcus sp.]|uniref:class I SAM-dependent methyltransferase n=1 Tax=Hyphococcus sp. TaxID=2038636 RepID=UPI002085DE03|nr:MAG: hypothetical protein DHS20C04_00240 [Marinicaulis sp.]
METTAVANTIWFGPEHSDEGWVPAPRYLLRRARILRHMRDMPPGDIVEVGSASGALLSEFSSKGFRCTGLETSEAAIALARRINKAAAVKFQGQPDTAWRECFDYCFSFEVLEHIEHDADALKEWAGWLRPGGAMLLSVPAHPRLWNARDVWAGHFRRYRRNELERIFADAGFVVEKIECYGFPLANILELIIAPSYKKNLRKDSQGDAIINKSEQTAASGIKRSTDVKMFGHYARAPGAWIMRAMIMVQTLFLRVGFGNGYFVVARKPLQSRP